MKVGKMTPAVAAGCVLALAACGGSSGHGSTGAGSSNSSGGSTASAGTTRPSGEQGAVYDAVIKFETSPDCEGITDAALKKLAGLGETRHQQCQIARVRNYPPISSVKVQAIQVNGAQASAQVPAQAGGVSLTQGGKPVVEKVKLIKVGGRWLISDATTD